LDQYCLTRIVFLSAQCPQQEDILRKVIWQQKGPLHSKFSEFSRYLTVV
jgi:hypothetical protein